MRLFAGAKYEVFDAWLIREDLFDVVHVLAMFLFNQIQ
jgi:hypothetical protein